MRCAQRNRAVVATETLRRAYASDITGWINRNGGLTNTFIWLRAPEIYRYFKKC